MNRYDIYDNMNKLSLDEILKDIDDFNWRDIIDFKDVPVDVFIENIEDITYGSICFNVHNIKNYILKNKNMSIEDLLRIRNKAKELPIDIDRMLIFNNNMTREKYDEIVFGMDNKTFYTFEKLSGKNDLLDFVHNYSFEEDMLKKILAESQNNFYIAFEILHIQKISEEFAKKLLTFNPHYYIMANYIQNNKPSVEFVKNEILSRITYLEDFRKNLDETMPYDIEYILEIFDGVDIDG